MKKLLKSLLALVLAFSFSTAIYAQNADFKSNAYVGAGFSLVGGLIDLAGEIPDVAGTIEGSALPALQANFDYGVTNWLSLGAGVSYQRLNVDIGGYTFTQDSINFTTEDVAVDINRVVVGARILFHYANNDKLDLYSGLRLNYKSARVNTTSTDPTFDLDRFQVALPFGVQIIPFSLRYYVTDNIGLSFETAIGAPHFLSVGANYRM